MEKDPKVEMVGITKEFFGIKANNNVNFSLQHNEIHALLGENGAGKSTLMNVLTGIYRPDSGIIRVNGKIAKFSSPKDSISKGIGMVHQHFKLIGPFSVAENIMLCLEGLKLFYDLKAIEEQIATQSEKYGLSIDPKAKVYQLSIGEQQRVEIMKMLFKGADVLILDEPTAVLTPSESVILFQTLRKMAESGKSVVLISHKMDEVKSYTDRVTVLRDGKSAATVKTNETDDAELAQMMVGRVIPPLLHREDAPENRAILELRDCSVSSSKDMKSLKNCSFSINAGEIFGIAGVDGNGQNELAELVAGMRRADDGAVFFKGEDCTADSREQRMERHVGYVPEDRMTTGLVNDMNAIDNSVLSSYRHLRGMFINWTHAGKSTQHLIEKYNIKLSSPTSPVKMMSGGNIQKLLLAREIESDPDLIVAVYPMRGLDISAVDYVKALLFERREQKKAVLLISEDLNDLLVMSDRIAVLHSGCIMGIVKSSDTTMEALGLMMAGKRKEEYCDIQSE